MTSPGRLAASDVRHRGGPRDQDPHLFDTTLAANVRIGRSSATDGEVSLALKQVGLGPWLEGLPDGLGTEVGPRGACLLGGQRQRVCMARSLLADSRSSWSTSRPNTSTWPPRTPHGRPVGGRPTRSVLLVTHRLAGLQAADEILVVEAGRVVERGTHAGLLALGRRYRAVVGANVSADRPAPDSRPADAACGFAPRPRGPEGARRGEHRSGPLAVRHHQHLPLPLRPDHHRAGGVGGGAADDVVSRRERGIPPPARFFGAPAHQRGHRRSDGAGPGVRVRHELVGYSPSSATSSAARWPSRASVPSSWSRPSWACGSSAGTGCPSASTWPASGSWRGTLLSASSSWPPTRGCSIPWDTR